MSDQSMSEALDAIHDESMKLLGMNLPSEAERIIELIASISRYKHDVRSIVGLPKNSPISQEGVLESDNPDVWLPTS